MASICVLTGDAMRSGEELYGEWPPLGVRLAGELSPDAAGFPGELMLDAVPDVGVGESPPRVLLIIISKR